MEREDLEDGKPLAEISDAWDTEDLLPLDESAGHIPPDPPQSAGDTSHAIATLRQAVLHPVRLAGPTAATGAEDQHEHSPGGLTQPATYSVGNPRPLTGTGMEGIPHSGSALLDFNMREINGALTPTAPVKDIVPVENPPREPTPVVVNAGLTVPEPDRDPYSTGDTSCPSTAADMGISSPDLEVNTGPGLPQSGGGASLADAPVLGSCKRKKLVCGSSSQRSTPEFNLVELEAGLVQSDPSSADIKPPTGSTDIEIIRFLISSGESLGKEVNLSLGEQDQMAPKAVRSYVTTVEMMPDQKTHLGYWKEKEVRVIQEGYFSVALKRTLQFHRYDGTKTNWFMHEYIPTNSWGIDLYVERLRFRVLEYEGDAQVPGETTSLFGWLADNFVYNPQIIKLKCSTYQAQVLNTSPRVKIMNKIAAVKHRMRGPDDPKVVKGESPAWQHFIKIYDRHPELAGSKVVYAVRCHCEGVVKASTKNGTKSLLTHCNRTCPRKHLQPSFDLRSALSSRPPLLISSFPPSRIPCSQWEKRECIGCGSFGQVYRGFNSEHGQSCAIKEVLVILDDPRSKEQLRQLNQEICLLEQWSHPNIVQYYGSIMTDYALSIYMEYVPKGSINALLAKFGPFKESMIRSYTAQILSGLVFLHERRHIHRDIKGVNILVGPNNEVKLADFGLAKHIQTLTAAHTSCRGTPCWMAPEVILSNHSGKGYNLSADIWSLGCTVIEMATGKPPLHGYDPIQAIFKIANDKTYIPEIPDVLSDEGKHFVQLCLQRTPASRPSAAQLMDHPFIQNQGS